MDKLTAFKVAFLSRCAEEGLDIDQIHQRVKEAVARVETTLEKKAIIGAALAPVMSGIGFGTGFANPDIIGKGLSGLYGGISGFVNSPKNDFKTDALSAGAGATLGWNANKIVPLLLGGGALLAGGGLAAGKMLADSTDDPMAVDEVKQQELISEYKRLTDKAKRQTKFRQLKGM